VIALVALYLLRRPILIEAARILVVDDAPAKSDYIIVLGGDPNSRPFLAADLYKKGIAPTILVCQGKTDNIIEAGLAMTEDQVYTKSMEREGVPSDAIEQLPGAVESTEDEANSLARFLADKSSVSLTIVTSAEHTRRARWVFKKILKNHVTDIRMAASHNPWYNETNWWQDDLGATGVAHEYLKFPFYYVRYAW